ncbi:MAG: hypothetical protein M0D57_16845 [Sphingobacteriales bacterium JAD_PAG50586_3]|nr:MAG: hypothetical protein M0D57_16845 [Sphingobacteriales bacterium JAD_PAG50586_3]
MRIGLLTNVMQLLLLTATSVVFAQDQYCEKPAYAPRKERHMNCSDALGRRQGVWKSYNYYGYVISEIAYKDNKFNGPVVIYYATTGKTREKSNYFDGKRDGEYTSYFFRAKPMPRANMTMAKK